jgi:hypothetical protein
VSKEQWIIAVPLLYLLALVVACSSSDSKGPSTPKVDLTVGTVGIERASPTVTRTPAPSATPEPPTPTPTPAPTLPPPPIRAAPVPAPSQPSTSPGPGNTGNPPPSGGATQSGPAPTATRAATSGNTAPAPQAKLRIVSLPATSRGASASLRIVTSAGGSCFATYLAPGAAITAVMNLPTRNADQAGVITWTWPISTSSQAGTGTAKVTCGAQTATQFLTVR